MGVFQGADHRRNWQRVRQKGVVINMRKGSSTYDGVVDVFKAHRPGYFKNNQLPPFIQLPSGARLYCPGDWNIEEA